MDIKEIGWGCGQEWTGSR